MFEVPQSKKSIKQNQFEFTIGKQRYSVPLLKFAPIEAAELLEQGKQVAAFLTMLGSDAARDAVRQLDGEQFAALAEAWTAASGVDAGESPASSD